MELFPSVVVWGAGRVGKIQRANALDFCCCSNNFHSKCCWCWWFDLILNFPPVEISTRWLVITLDGISRLCRRLDNIADVMISFQPLLINQPKAKKEKMRKTFSVESQIPPRNNLCVCDSSVYLEHFYGRHTRSLPVELLVVLGLYSHRFGDKKKTRKLFVSFRSFTCSRRISLSVCVQHTQTKSSRNVIPTLKQMTNDWKRWGGELYHKSEPQSAGTRA